MRRRFLLFFALVAAQTGCGLLGATNLFVSPAGTGSACTQGSPCSLATALKSASPGTVVYLARGTYAGSGAAVASIAKSLTLDGGWDGTSTQPPIRDPKKYVTTLDGQNRRRVVLIEGTATVVIDGLSLVRGNATGDASEFGAGGGLRATSAIVTLRNCVVRKNLGSSKRGAIGGGISLNNCQTTIDACTIDGNIGTSVASTSESGSGGGICAMQGTLVVRGCTISNNISAKNCGGTGGGLLLSALTSVTIEKNIIRGNSGSRAAWVSDGGGIWLGWVKKASIAGNRIERNWTSQHPTNGAGYGGGMVVYDTTATIAGNWILRNSCGSWTGGMRPGGGIAVCSKLPVTIINNIIAQNDGGEFGDGVYVGLYSGTAGKTTLIHNTIRANKANGVMVNEHARVTMQNNIVSGHLVGVDNRSLVGATLSADHNLLWNTMDPITGRNAIMEDPILAADDHLTAGSPAIDAGMAAAVTVDIDGQPRDSLPDIGADEFLETSAWDVRAQSLRP